MIYNDKKYKHYWLVPVDNRFKAALISIGVDKDSINRMLGIRKHTNVKYIFVGYFHHGWGYNYIVDKYDYDECYDRYGLTFGGYVNIREEEIVATKYNI